MNETLVQPLHRRRDGLQQPKTVGARQTGFGRPVDTATGSMPLSRKGRVKGPSSRIEAPERYVGYEVYDPLGQKIGKVENIFVNGDHEPEYVRVKTGLVGTKSVLIPVRPVEVDEERRSLVLR